MIRRAPGRGAERWGLLLAALAVAVSCGLGAGRDGAGEAADGASSPPTAADENGPRRSARRALVVGINDYSASRLPPVPGADGAPPGRRWPDLRGPVNDARAVREVLIARYGLAEGDVRLLLDQEATREGILGAIRRHLVEPAQSGDELVFYYAGHGSQVRNSGSREPDGLDESLVPADSRRGAPDIRDKELRGLLNQALDRGARVTVILDSCHSGSGVRALDERAARGLRLDPRDVADGDDPGPALEDRDAVVLTAAQDFEPALEIWDPERDRVHGAFTLALLHALRAAEPTESAESLFRRTRAWLHGPQGNVQQPTLAGRRENLERPLLGGAGAAPDDRTLAAVEAVGEGGEVILQAGWIHGLAVGSELESAGASAPGPARRLRVTALEGLTRSRAEVVAGASPARVAGAADRPVLSGELYSLAGWAVPPGPPLRVWVASAGEPARRQAAELIEGALEAGIALTSDPTAGPPPTHVVSRRDDGWSIAGADPSERIEASGPSSVIEEIRRWPGQARVFVDLPAPAALAAALGRELEGRKVEIVDRPAKAEYVLAGRSVEGMIELAWLLPGATSEDEVRSSLPLRSRWQPTDQPVAEVARALATDAARLARVRGWLRLAEESPPAGDFPYRLSLRTDGDGEARTGGELRQGELYVLELSATPERLERAIGRRFVYAFIVDSSGGCSLLHPFPGWGNVENRYPLEPLPPYPSVLRLGQELRVEVTEPFGVDTYYLLTSVEPIPDPDVLECPPVRGTRRGPPSALEELLAATGELTRGGRPERVPGSWSLQRLTFRSLPSSATGAGANASPR